MANQFNGKPAIILLVEDNPADQEITRRALENAKVHNELYIANDGVEALHYLRRQGKFADINESPRPDIILLDIDMPRMDGKQLLQVIKTDNDFKAIPVVMLTTSDHERDILETYHLGANAYITKPMELEKFIGVIKDFENFWLVLVNLPKSDKQ